ncbi:MAG TPA: hypothetical protein VGG08_06130 [Solirubrobacteraceae bacterium]|jgi:hypothetical protein
MSAVEDLRERTFTWDDPTAGASVAREMSGLDYMRAIAEGRVPQLLIAHGSTGCVILR